MDINILNQTVIMESVSWYIPVLVGLVILAVSSFVIGFNINNDIGGIFVVFGLMCILTMSVIGIWEPKVETDRYRYEVTIGKNVSFSEIYEKYDVIEQRGKIWILEDKEDGSK